MSTTELAVRQATVNVDDLGRIAKMLALSGYFEANQNLEVAVAQMATRVLAGHEMGFGPFASATGVYIINGKPVLAAGLLAAAVKASGKYDYRVRKNESTAVSIEFFQRQAGGWESLGLSTFTADDAKTAQLIGKDNWRNFPRNMLFARAMSNGVRWFAPDIFAGNIVYTPEELGVDVDAETGEILSDAKIEPPAQPFATRGPTPEQDFGMRNGSTGDLETLMDELAALHAQSRKGPASEKAYGYLVSVLDEATAPEGHHAVLHAILGREVSKDNPPSAEMVGKMLSWLCDKRKVNDTYVDNADYRPEVKGMVQRIYAQASGQQELPL